MVLYKTPVPSSCFVCVLGSGLLFAQKITWVEKGKVLRGMAVGTEYRQKLILH